MDKHLKEGIEILRSLGEDTDTILKPLKEAEKFEKEVKKMQSYWRYFTPEEKKEFYNISK